MSNLSRKLMMGAAGAAGEALGIEDVFSTWLYTGTGSTQTITNGIDLSGEGGLVWLKERASSVLGSAGHFWCDTARGRDKFTGSDDTAGNDTATSTEGITAFNSDGFTLGTDISGKTNYSSGNTTYASWTFRKAPGFFDVVTFTSNGASSQQIAHNLGSVPGCIIVKRTSGVGGWFIYHRGTDASVPEQYGLEFTTDARNNNNGFWNNTQPTSTHFTLGNLYQSDTNTYVAYLFAHDEQIFGEGGDQSVIKCGSYTGNGSTSGPVIDLGWEPQWVLIKTSSQSGGWVLFDTMRGIPTDGNDALLIPNMSVAEETVSNWLDLNATGFQPRVSFGNINTSGATYIYIAIRRGPMKTPTDATTVFATDTSDATSPSPPQFNAGFPPDAVFRKDVDTISGTLISSRLQDTRFMYATSTAAEDTASLLTWDNMYGWSESSGVDTSLRAWMFRRAPGFFDVVAYTGNGATNRAITHNLGDTPGIFIIKNRSSTSQWYVYTTEVDGTLDYLILNNADYYSNAGSGLSLPSSTSIYADNGAGTNTSANNYIAYLFGTVSGVSKIGTYTGTGSTINVDCGFTAGARFVLIKRWDVGGTGDWYVWDTARGIVSGNDPYYRLNVEAAQVTTTDYIDPLNSGFEISSTAPDAINASGGTFIFLAIA